MYKIFNTYKPHTDILDLAIICVGGRGFINRCTCMKNQRLSCVCTTQLVFFLFGFLVPEISYLWSEGSPARRFMSPKINESEDPIFKSSMDPKVYDFEVIRYRFVRDGVDFIY